MLNEDKIKSTMGGCKGEKRERERLTMTCALNQTNMYKNGGQDVKQWKGT